MKFDVLFFFTGITLISKVWEKKQINFRGKLWKYFILLNIAVFQNDYLEKFQ